MLYSLFRKLLFALLAWLGACPVCRAQAEAPAGGYRLRAVPVLRRVPEPPGGLIPYRQGHYWGYADSTGRLVVSPELAYDSAAETTLLDGGFAEISPATLPEKFNRRLLGRRGYKRYWYRAVFLNAVGELLLVRADEAALLLPDGSLALRKRAEVVGQTELYPPNKNWQGERLHTGFTDFASRRIQAFELVPSARYVRFGLHTHLGDWLGEQRISLLNRVVGEHMQFGPDTAANTESLRQLTRRNNPVALATLDGHCLTSYQFATIFDFSQGVAQAAVTTYQGTKAQPVGTDTWGYLLPNGHWLIRPSFTEAGPFRQGRAVVEVQGQQGIIGLDGHYQLRPQLHPLTEAPDEAGFVRQQLVDSSQAELVRARLLPPPGIQLTGDSIFSGVGAFHRGRAWARQGERRGLIDQHGRWLTPVAYDLLAAPDRLRPSRRQLATADRLENFWEYEVSDAATQAYHYDNISQLYPEASQPPADTAYLVARRAGRYGFVARHSGQEVVPCRYDSVLLCLYRGFGCAVRGGTAYVITPQGRELVAAHYDGLDFQTSAGRLLHLRRPQDSTWALLDTTGRLRTAWLPGNGYPVAGGWYLSREGRSYTVRDAAGHLSYSAAYPIDQQGCGDLWRVVMPRPTPWRPVPPANTHYWQLHWENPQVPGRVFLVVATPDTARLLDIRLREVGRFAYQNTIYPPLGYQPLGHGWYAVAPLGTTWFPAKANQLLLDTGQLLPLLPNNGWVVTPGFDYRRLYHERRLLLTAKGYLTRGGRALWQE